eukprot:5903823-Amphidinium_carterae.1
MGLEPYQTTWQTLQLHTIAVPAAAFHSSPLSEDSTAVHTDMKLGEGSETENCSLEYLLNLCDYGEIVACTAKNRFNSSSICKVTVLPHRGVKEPLPPRVRCACHLPDLAKDKPTGANSMLCAAKDRNTIAQTLRAASKWAELASRASRVFDRMLKTHSSLVGL